MPYYHVSATIIVLRSDGEMPGEFFDETLDILNSGSTLHCEHQEDVRIFYDNDRLCEVLPQKPGLYTIQTIFSVSCYRTNDGDYDCDYDLVNEVISKFSDEEQEEYLKQFDEQLGDLE